MTISNSIVPEPGRSSRLSELGLSEETLRNAMFAANLAAARVTENHPRGWGNLERYGYGIAELRTLLIPGSWTRYEEDRLEGVLSPDRRVLLLVSSGTRETGREGGLAPQTKNIKGPKLSARVEANGQLDIFGELSGQMPRSSNSGATETWILLHHADAITGECRMELSRPTEIKNNRPAAWSERIPLKPFAGQVDHTGTNSGFDWDRTPDDDIDLDWRDSAAGE